MSVSKQQYSQMVKNASPNSKSYINIPVAFVVGGLICVIGELISSGYSAFIADEKLSSGLTSATLIFLSILLTGLGIYPIIAKHGGAGTLVPITGFANAVASPAIEFKSEGFILGVGAKIFLIAGPVILYGVTASVIYGIIYYFIK